MEASSHPDSDTAYPNFSHAAFPSNAPFRNLPTRSQSPPRLGNYSSAAGHEHGVDSSDSNPSSSQSAGKEISDHEQLSSTTYMCVYPGCDRGFARDYDLDRHIKIHFPSLTTKLDCPQGAKVGSFCKRVGERGFTRKDHLHEHLRTVHFVNVPESSRGRRDQPPQGEIEPHSKKDTTNMSSLTTVVEPQQDEECQPKLEGDFNDEALTVSSSGSSNPKKYAFSNNETGSKLMRLTFISDVAMISAVRDSRDMTGVASQLTSECVAKEAFKMQPSDTPLHGVVLGSQNGIVSEQQTLSRACNVSDAPLPGSRKIGHGSHPSGHEGAEKPHNALEGQVAKKETAFDSAVFYLNRQEYRKAERVLRQLPRIGDPDYKSKLYLLLAGSRKIGHGSHPSEHKEAEKPHNALEGQVAKKETAFDSAVFYLNHQEYRKAEDILRQLPRIGHPDYELKLYLLLAEAYQGQRPLGKARRLALASLCKWRALHHKTYPRWGRSADLHIAFITALGNNLEANALRKVHRPRRSYTAAFVGLAMKVGAMSCGQRLFDDFIETRPGAAEELRAALDTFDRQRPTSHSPAYPAASYQSYSGSTNMSGNPTRDTAASPAGAVDPNFTPPRSIYDPPPTSGGLFSTNRRCDEPPESKWLLICAQAWRRPTSLLHLD
ncbi:MAG: hypothetical protein LQ349_008996, partial [Xanthoria aureola]